MQIEALFPQKFGTWTEYAKRYCNAHMRYDKLLSINFNLHIFMVNIKLLLAIFYSSVFQTFGDYGIISLSKILCGGSMYKIKEVGNGSFLIFYLPCILFLKLFICIDWISVHNVQK